MPDPKKPRGAETVQRYARSEASRDSNGGFAILANEHDDHVALLEEAADLDLDAALARLGGGGDAFAPAGHDMLENDAMLDEDRLLDDVIALDPALEGARDAGADVLFADEDSLAIPLDLGPEAGAAALVDDMDTAPAGPDDEDVAAVAVPAAAAPRAASIPESAPAIAGEEPAFDRSLFLAPYMGILETALAQHVDSEAEGDLVMTFAGDTVTLGEWERGIADQVFGASERTNNAALRIVESLALEAKIKEDLARHRIATSLQVPRIAGDAADGTTDEPTEVVRVKAPAHVQDEIKRDAALARALLSELQRVIDASVVGGNMKAARQLNQFKPNLHHALNDLRELLDADERRETEELATSVIVFPEDAQLPDIKPPKKKQRRQEASDDIAMTMKPSLPLTAYDKRRVRMMVLAFSGLCLLWLALTVPRLMREEMRAFTAEDFHHIRGVHAVVARPPSLFVTLDAGVWASLKDRDRKQLIDDIAFDVQRAGYSGARFTTQNGTTVAQWLRARGTEMVAPPKTDERSR